jgi:putative spermidine/putrescine transport system permease protein
LGRQCRGLDRALHRLGGAIAATADAAGRIADDPAGLRRAHRRGERRRQLWAFGLTLPLLGFLLAVFILPIAGMLRLSVANDELRAVLPATAEALLAWSGEGLPDEAVASTLAVELREARAARTIAAVAQRLNNADSGARSLIMGTARRLPEAPDGTWLATLAAIDPVWGEPRIWRLLRRAAATWTDLYLLQAVDLVRDRQDAIVAVPAERAVYRNVLWRTFEISLIVTLACLVIGYPLAYKLATLPPRIANPLMILVLLPFWTSLLVRSAAWIVVLQREGPINQTLLWLGLAGEPVQLVFNRTGVLIAMTHVLLPFMVLPLVSVMRTIPRSHMQAAIGLGAAPFTAFRKVFLPQTRPGVGAGCLLVFIISIGYYITPALVGGAADQMISYFVAFFTLETVNWGMAAALGSILLAATLILYLVYARLVGIDRLRIS